MAGQWYRGAGMLCSTVRSGPWRHTQSKARSVMLTRSPSTGVPSSVYCNWGSRTLAVKLECKTGTDTRTICFETGTSCVCHELSLCGGPRLAWFSDVCSTRDMGRVQVTRAPLTSSPQYPLLLRTDRVFLVSAYRGIRHMAGTSCPLLPPGQYPYAIRM